MKWRVGMFGGIAGCQLNLFGIAWTDETELCSRARFGQYVSGLGITVDIPCFGSAMCAFSKFGIDY